MTRRIFTTVAMLSLLVLVMTCAFWIRSYWRTDVFAIVTSLQGPSIDAQTSQAMIIYTQQGLSPPRERYWKDISRELIISRGRFAFATEEDSCFPRKSIPWTKVAGRVITHQSRPPRELFKLLLIQGFDATGDPNRRMREEVEPSWPMWIPTIATGVIPLIWVGLWLRRRRRRHVAGHCIQCGYDLRESKERCPDCGELTSAAP